MLMITALQYLSVVGSHSSFSYVTIPLHYRELPTGQPRRSLRKRTRMSGIPEHQQSVRGSFSPGQLIAANRATVSEWRVPLLV